MKSRWYSSTRLWVAVISAISVTVINFFPDKREWMISLTAIAMTYIGGKSYSDGKRVEGALPRGRRLLMETETTVQLQFTIFIEELGEDFTDSFQFTPHEYNALSDDDLAGMVKSRVDAHIQFIKNASESISNEE